VNDAHAAAPADVTLVPLDETHLVLTRAWANDAELARLMDRAKLVSEDEHRAWFAALHRREDCRYFAVVERAVHVGNVWLWAIDVRHRKAEIRIVIGDPGARGRGVGTRALDLVSRYAFEQLGLHRVYAYVLALNPRARRAFEKAGFALEGTLRDDRHVTDGYVDSYLLSRLA
jgi:UDP-4-amino-4,6-dideoxy-N-acetyl-beta-L-altrosamine N-acetyltransferase